MNRRQRKRSAARTLRNQVEPLMLAEQLRAEGVNVRAELVHRGEEALEGYVWVICEGCKVKAQLPVEVAPSPDQMALCPRCIADLRA